MSSRLKRIVVACILSLLASAPAHAIESVNIMADSHLSAVMSHIARYYSRSTGNVANLSFLPASTQDAQIAEGGAADVLVTSQTARIEQLKTQGLIDFYSQTPIARDRLALVGPLESPIQARLAQAFPTAQIILQLGFEPGFVVGHPETLQEGIYGKEAMRNLGAAADLEPYTLYIKDLRQMLDMVARQNAYGVFFYSSVLAVPGLRVIDLFPESSHTPIQYYAVVIASDNMNQARNFMAYLKTPAVRSIFRDNGFIAD